MSQIIVRFWLATSKAVVFLRVAVTPSAAPGTSG
jgi:hypothetical protein